MSETAGLRWTGHALVDVGIAGICAAQNRTDPTTITMADLDCALIAKPRVGNGSRGIRLLLNDAALLSMKRMLERDRLPWRALMRSSLPLCIQKPSYTAGIREYCVTLESLFIFVEWVPSMGERTNGHFCGLPVEPLMPYQQSR